MCKISLEQERTDGRPTRRLKGRLYPSDTSKSVHCNDLPPSTGSSIPVMKLASSLASHAAAFPISAGVANLPNGIAFITVARPSSVSVPPSTLATMPVSAITGQIALHLTPSFANSAAKPLVIADTAPLEPAYQTRFGRGRGAEIEEMFTKTPCFCLAK